MTMKPLIRSLCLSALRRGVKKNAIAKVLGVSNRTVSRNTKASRRKSARKSCQMVKDRRSITRQLSKKTTVRGNYTFQTFSTARSIQGQLQLRGIKCSVRTVRRDLRSLGGRCVVRRRVPTRQPDQLQARKLYAKKYQKYASRRFVFSDEAWITSNECTGATQWIFKDPRTQQFSPRFPLERKTKWNVSALQVWASCGVGFKGPIVIFPSWKWEGGSKKGWRMTKEQYIRRCLAKIAPQLAAEKRLFIQDGARCHSNKQVFEYCLRKGITLVEFAPYCPDLNRQEVIWSLLKKRVGEKVPTDLEDLRKKIVEAWNELPQQDIDRVCKSYKQSLEKVARE